MSSHRQVWVKVNAPVDAGIAPVVEALSEFPGLQTGDSCQGYAPEGEESWGTVVFCYAPSNPDEVNHSADTESLRDPANFAVALGCALFAVVADDAELSVSYSHNPPLLTLGVRETAVQGVALRLREIAARDFSVAEWRDSRNLQQHSG